MTDKQTIDVSKCKFYRDEVFFVGGITLTDVCSIWIWQRDHIGLEPSCIMKCHCSDNPNCYYKQLKAKEQEQECEALQMSENEAGEIIAELKAECKRLKYDNGYEVGTLEKTIDNLKAENETYKKMFEDEDVRLALNEIRTGERHLWFNKAEKLKQALADIKEIAETCSFTDSSELLLSRIGQILQKISECEVENES